MRLLLEAEADVGEPSASDLDEYRREHGEDLARPARIAFEHRFFSRSRRGDAARDDASSALENLRRERDVPGDPFLLGTTVPSSPVARIAATFGETFVTRLQQAELGAWTGPIASTYGEHLVNVTDREPESVPRLEEIRDTVEVAWRRDALARATELRLGEIAQGYRVIRADRR
jgi:hypothetical protein